MKTFYTSSLCIAFFLIFVQLSAQTKFRSYPFKKEVSGAPDPGTGQQPTVKDERWFFAPSVSIDVFTKDNKTGKYAVGAIPGAGYGIRYKPERNFAGQPFKLQSLFSVDVFAQGVVLDELDDNPGQDYFVVDLLPVLTIANWIGIGYGPRFKIGLNKVPNTSSGVLTLGIKKTL